MRRWLNESLIWGLDLDLQKYILRSYSFRALTGAIRILLDEDGPG
jgi:hypothetical protein